MYKIEITDAAAMDAFNRMIEFGQSPDGALRAIGEVVIGFTKSRFEQSIDPYGNPWAPNSDTTLRALLARSGKNFTKKGALSKRGQTVLAGKKPLIGESRSLSTQFTYRLPGDSSVEITSPMVYAGMQNVGGTKAEFPHLWGDIPARPFFPDEGRGLPGELTGSITQVLVDALQAKLSR
jgi:hypothetical protein